MAMCNKYLVKGGPTIQVELLVTADLQPTPGLYNAQQERKTNRVHKVLSMFSTACCHTLAPDPCFGALAFWVCFSSVRGRFHYTITRKACVIGPRVDERQ